MIKAKISILALCGITLVGYITHNDIKKHIAKKEIIILPDNPFPTGATRMAITTIEGEIDLYFKDTNGMNLSIIRIKTK